MKNTYLNELQIMRGIALLSVVAIHLGSVCISKVPKGDSTYWVYYFIGVLAQYAVPCFLLIASILVSYNEKKMFSHLFKFYLGKVPRIVVPYILWTLFYVGLRVYSGNVTFTQAVSPKSWAFWLLFGKGYGHLYFISIILQFYIIAPLLVKLVKLMKSKWHLMAAASILIQVLFYFINKKYIFPYFPYPATLVLRYLGIVITGIWIGFNYEKTLRFLNTYWYLIVGLFITFSGFYIYDSLRILSKLPINSLAYQMFWYGYVLTAALLWLSTAHLLSSGTSRPAAAFKWLGNVSFGVYLIHPVCIAVFRRIANPSASVLLLAAFILGLIGICAIVGLAVSYIGKIPFIGLIIGEVPKAASVPTHTTTTDLKI